MSQDDQTPTTTPDGPHDDLERIDGIGEKTALRLHDAGIHTFEDVAARTAEALASALAGSGLSAKRISDEDWIGQAERLAAPPQLRILVERLTPIRDGRRTFTLALDDPCAARLVFRVIPGISPPAEVFDFEATIEAREYYGRRRFQPVGVETGEVHVLEPVRIDVTGTPLRRDLYRLVVRLELYPHGHTDKKQRLYSHDATGDLVQVGDALPEDPAAP